MVGRNHPSGVGSNDTRTNMKTGNFKKQNHVSATRCQRKHKGAEGSKHPKLTKNLNSLISRVD